MKSTRKILKLSSQAAREDMYNRIFNVSVELYTKKYYDSPQRAVDDAIHLHNSAIKAVERSDG